MSFLLPEDSFVAFRRAYLRKMLMGYHHLPMYLWDADGIWGAMHKKTPFRKLTFHTGGPTVLHGTLGIGHGGTHYLLPLMDT